jgi:hypothetical protein
MWEEGNDVLADHIRWSRYCKLINRDATNNVPINETFLLESLPSTPPWSEPIEELRYSINVLSINNENESNDNESNLNEAEKMSNSKFAIEANRLKSYKDWPIAIKQKPHQLSDAGFYYTGIGDKVCCYYCGGGLKDWEEEDDPWENHAMWYGKCKYVKTVKGDNFIEKMNKKREFLFNNKLPSSNKEKKEENKKKEEENKKEDDDNIGKKCKICFENDYNTVFIPCGHVISCAKCSLSVTKCPACRQSFERVINIYYS